MFRRLRRAKPANTPPPPPLQPSTHEPLWRGWFPEPGDVVVAGCGCTGPVAYASRRYNGHVHYRVTAPCRSGHAAVGVIEHLHLRDVRPASEGMEQAAA